MDASEIDFDEFSLLVERALSELPAWVKDEVDELAVLVDDQPSAEEAPADGGLLLGNFHGIEQTRRGDRVPGSLPSTITLFRLSILAVVSDREELVERVKLVLQHEVGHALGMSEERLRELGVN